ncbi:hypothetical protein ACFQ77_41095 [Streptomyces virginiae]
MSIKIGQSATGRPVGIAQRIADVVIDLVRFLGPDPAAIVRKGRRP